MVLCFHRYTHNTAVLEIYTMHAKGGYYAMYNNNNGDDKTITIMTMMINMTLLHCESEKTGPLLFLL